VGKGYFVANDDISQNRKVFLLFDNLTPYKEVLHSAFQQAIGTAAITDLYFHHGNAKMAANLLQEASGHYTDYAIMPLDHPLFQAAMQSLPRQHIIILDQGRLSFGHQYSSICQNFEKDVFLALTQGLPLLKKYSTLNFCSRDQRGHFQELLHGCARFCAEHGISFRHQTAVSDLLKAGEAWLVMHDKDLVEIVKMSREAGLNLGQELGLISYNDIPMKEVIADGITTISTDFAQMGTALAAAIQQRGQVQIENPSRLIIRKSL
jgi:DNA-binding LacI/PurR family transcriptional regulator